MKILNKGGRICIRDDAGISDFPIAVRTGDLVFVPAAYSSEPASRNLRDWAPRIEGTALLERLDSVLAECDGLDRVAYLIQHMVGRDMTAAFSGERRARFHSGYPASTAVGVTALATPMSRLQLDCVAFSRSAGAELLHVRDPSSRVAYSDAVVVGDTAYLAGVIASDQEVSAEPTRWTWDPVKGNIRWLVREKLQPVLAQIGCDLSNVVSLHCHVRNPRKNVPPLLEVLGEIFGNPLPLLMISPASELHYAESLIELTAVALKPGGSTLAEPIDFNKSVFGGPDAMRINNHVYCATLVDQPGAVKRDRRGDYLTAPSAREMRGILERIEAIAEKAGGALDSIARLRLYVEDPRDAAPALDVIRTSVGTDMAVSLVCVAEAAGWLGESIIAADAVLHIPKS